jgi:hypothetical protein
MPITEKYNNDNNLNRYLMMIIMMKVRIKVFKICTLEYTKFQTCSPHHITLVVVALV